MAQHIDDDAAAVLFAIVPRRTLAGDRVALKHPITKLPAHGKNVTEEAFLTQALQLHQARKPQLVGDNAVFYTCGLGALIKVNRDGKRIRDRLLAVDML